MRKINQSSTRRNVLKLSGASLAGLSSVNLNVIGSASAGGNNPGKPEVPNTPIYKNNGMIGYAKGTYKQPVDPATIEKIQNDVVGNIPQENDNNGTLVYAPKASEKENSGSVILGYGMKWKNGEPYIKISRGPMNDNMEESLKQSSETRSHEKVDDFAGLNEGDK